MRNKKLLVIETRGERVRNKKLRGNTSTKCKCLHAISSFSRVPKCFDNSIGPQKNVFYFLY